MAATRSSLLEHAVAARALEGVSGDQCLVREDGNTVLMAVVDGLGHGPDAACAAAAAVDALRASTSCVATELVSDCHRALAATRGVVMALAIIDARSAAMTWLGVGNVEGRLVRHGGNAAPSCRALLLSGGIVGHRLPPLHPMALGLERGDLLAFATDGISGNFEDQLLPQFSPRQAATRILAHYGKQTDDCLVLVGRWIGPP
jgi:phosphoserine phosphatase RsbX